MAGELADRERARQRVPLRLLVLRHYPSEQPAAFEAVMRERGIEQVVVALDEGERPSDGREFDAVLAMGGPMGAYDEDEHPWLRLEKRLVRDVVDAGKPYLGVCLGAQVLASALGAQVYPAAIHEIGVLPVSLTPAGRTDRLLRGLGDPVELAQWHGDTFDLPRGAVLLARSEQVEIQAFRFGDRAYGVQFHPEVDDESARRWSELPDSRAALLELLGREGRDRFAAELQSRAREIAARGRRLFENWLTATGLDDMPPARSQAR